MRVADFDFELPPENIALRPVTPREAAKLLVVKDGAFSDLRVADLPGQLRSGDLLIFNDTKVIPAALSGHRVGRLATTPKIEALLHLRLDGARWNAFVKPAKKLEAGDTVQFGVLTAIVEAKGEAGEVTFRFGVSGAELDAALALVGRVPLPPYIESKRGQDAQDKTDYQTVYAKEEGAVAAPTAGLHFTPALMKALQEAGIEAEFVTLHVGAGTFLPVKADDTNDHKMHAEWGVVSPQVIDHIRAVKARGGRVISVGTTSLRLLESAAGKAFSGTTDIFITPGYKFNTVDGLITNFHLPRSTLFMLVCAFAGTDAMKAAYAHAILQNYRFYSYGDASLLWPAP
ncbi:MAG: tRNA preQ1(34) S-adenosylmethionine ribosyltransferase-isomerase QueA [Alphaproteobacteria bacterium]|nr:tRNA preQ1(34) S-adenosylmethionine ribosyltransferase-isomerase QueA [Alphaproteobacteria bacterium]